ncbi:UNVERIFIED_CONTAM: hypothetical protein Slati_3154900 [Sesamum latifolium]|uniref:Uncharacterized protein n=1 Tax=Sesamum latifolium TaxID=2727402 RepID=A0AAW2UYC6_9LAMI
MILKLLGSTAECGCFMRGGFIFLDPPVIGEDVAEEGKVEVVDELPAEGAHVDVGGVLRRLLLPFALELLRSSFVYFSGTS